MQCPFHKTFLYKPTLIYHCWSLEQNNFILFSDHFNNSEITWKRIWLIDISHCKFSATGYDECFKTFENYFTMSPWISVSLPQLLRELFANNFQIKISKYSLCKFVHVLINTCCFRFARLSIFFFSYFDLWLNWSVNFNSVFFLINSVYIKRSSVKWYNALYDLTYDRVNSKMYALVLCNSKFENFGFK